jgi:hypothetical protein
MLRKELASAIAQGENSKLAAEAAAASEEVIYKIDIPANRYDMLCVEVRWRTHFGAAQPACVCGFVRCSQATSSGALFCASLPCRALLGRLTSSVECSKRPRTSLRT